MRRVNTFSNMKYQQKEAIGLLSMGTFLEYFDLMLYVHMTSILNNIFFPKTDPFTTSILSAFSFCSTYVLRVFGAIIFGYIGDHIGRKTTVVITTIMMSISCIVMAVLPTYNEIGITAAWIVTICRMIQGLSTMGEVIGANVYITEITRPPLQYVAVGFIALCGSLGGVFALGVATLMSSYGFNWRNAFWIGSVIAVVGAAARTRLRETKDFADAKYRVKKAITESGQDVESLNENPIWRESLGFKTALALFCMECSWPVCFYLAYMYLGDLLMLKFSLEPALVVKNNYLLSIIQFFSWAIVIIASYRIYPITILKFKLVIFLPFLFLMPYMLNNISSPEQVLAMQFFLVAFGYMGVPAVPIYYRRLPIFKRFTSAAFSYALSRVFIYITSSFCLVIFTKIFGYYGILLITIPTAIGYIYSIYHFEDLEKQEIDLKLKK